MPPHRYITLRRVERAKALLRETRRSLSEIALDVGFGNQSHFTQVFHSATGQTPSQFRKRAEDSRIEQLRREGAHHR
jgi:AraC family transcriptional regulator